MIAEIKSLERGSRQTKNGAQAGLKVEFLNLERGTTKKEFLSDYHNSEMITVLEQIGQGGTVDVTYTPKEWNGRKYFNVTAVKACERPANAVTNKAQAMSRGSGKGEFRSVPQLILSDALGQSVIVVLKAADGHKVALDKLTEQILATAKEFNTFLTGQKPKADKPAEKQAPPKDETPPPSDDDAPPVDPDDDGIPF